MKTQRIISLLFLAWSCLASAQTNTITNDGLPYSQEAYQKWDKEAARIHAIVADGSTFSNVVGVLGSDYTIVTENQPSGFPGVTNWYWADFRCALPGDTNETEVIFRVTNNRVQWMPGAPPKMIFPPHKNSVTKPEK